MKLGPVLMATLMLASIGAGCGSGDDDSDAAGGTSESEAAPEQTSPQVAEPENAGADNAGAGDAVEFGDNGGIEFTFSGGHEESWKFVWIPVASSFAPGWWGMSFTEASAEGAAVFALSLNPANTNFSFGDGEVLIVGAAPQCSFNIDHQDSSGASGSLDCSDLTAIVGSGLVPGISLSATFDARQ